MVKDISKFKNIIRNKLTIYLNSRNPSASMLAKKTIRFQFSNTGTIEG